MYSNVNSEPHSLNSSFPQKAPSAELSTIHAFLSEVYPLISAEDIWNTSVELAGLSASGKMTSTISAVFLNRLGVSPDDWLVMEIANILMGVPRTSKTS